MKFTVLTCLRFDAVAKGRVNPDEINELCESLAAGLPNTSVYWDRDRKQFQVYTDIETEDVGGAVNAHLGLLRAELDRRHLSHLHIITGSSRVSNKPSLPPERLIDTIQPVLPVI